MAPDARNLAKRVEKLVVKGLKKKYKRFRVARFYGGCATADCVGCFLRCSFCWVKNSNIYPQQYGRYYSPEEVAEKLSKLDAPLYRISSGEPTIGKTHLIKFLENFNKPFLLETNGILLDKDYCNKLAVFPNVHVRLSLKGISEETFQKTTKTEGFKYQLEAARNLTNSGVSFPLAIINLYSKKQRDHLARFLRNMMGIRPSIQFYKKNSIIEDLFEVEKFAWYPFLAERGLRRIEKYEIRSN